MQAMAYRLLSEFAVELASAGSGLCAQHAWDGEAEHFQALSDRLHAGGLVALGSIRSRWLLEDELYTPDDSRRQLIADLLLGIGLVERAAGAQANFRADGMVEFNRSGTVASRVLPVSGRGVLRWSALEPLILRRLDTLEDEQPEHVMVNGAVGSRPQLAPPEDLLGDVEQDIVEGFGRPGIHSVDELRADPVLAEATGV
jgi:hypothetical protein